MGAGMQRFTVTEGSTLRFLSGGTFLELRRFFPTRPIKEMDDA
jgi:hypothetical protein